MSETREIRTDYLARVEGEGAMLVRVRDGELEEVQFKIFEPPRFFEALLRGRQFTEAPDITARICGICPIAYMASSAASLLWAVAMAARALIALLPWLPVLALSLWGLARLRARVRLLRR